MPSFVANTIFIPNGALDNRGGLISAVDGSVISGTVPEVHSGEGGAVLSNGTHYLIRIVGGVASDTEIYDANFNLVANPAPFSNTGWVLTSPIASDFVSTFYVSRFKASTASLVAAVSSTGVVGGTIYTLATQTIRAMTVDGANTVLYYCGQEVGAPIKRWDLVNNVALADLVPGFTTNQWGLDFMMLPGTNTFLATVQPNTGTNKYEVRLYNTSGTLLKTFPLVDDASLSSDARLALDLGAPTAAFWTRTYEDPSALTSTTSRIAVSNGATLVTFTKPTSSSDPTKAPFSCPMFAWGGAVMPPPITPPSNLPPMPPPAFPPPGGGVPPGMIPPPGTGSGASSGAVIVDPIRRVRRSPHLSKEQLFNFYSYFQLDFEAGADRPTTVADVVLHLRWSDDGGHTWSNLHPASVGSVGQYKYRAYWRRLGRSRDRVFEVVDSSNTKVVWLAAFMGLEPGTS